MGCAHSATVALRMSYGQAMSLAKIFQGGGDPALPNINSHLPVG